MKRLKSLIVPALMLGMAGGLMADEGKEKKLILRGARDKEGGEPRIRIIEDGREIKRQKVTYLGVVAGRVSPELASHLDLPEGVGLMVQHVAEKSPAADAGVKRYDVVHKMGDQVLVNQEQFTTLIRTHKAGDEVKMTVIRKGKPMEITAKLGESMEQPTALWRTNEGDVFRFIPDEGKWERRLNDPDMPMIRELEEFQRRLPMLRNHEEMRRMQEQMHIELEKMLRERMGRDGGPGAPEGPGARLGLGNATATAVASYADDEHTMKLTNKNGQKHLEAKDKEGTVLFDGSVNTKAEVEQIPEALREKFKRLDASTRIDIRRDGLPNFPDLPRVPREAPQDGKPDKPAPVQPRA